MKTTTTLTKRFIAALLMLALVCCAAFALSGCQSKEQQAEDALRTVLDDYSNGTGPLLDTQESQEVSQMGVDPSEIVSTLTADFSYEITGSKADDANNTVNVDVTIHSKQLTQAITSALPDMLSYAISASLTGATEDEVRQHVTQMLLEEIQAEDTTETSVTIPMTEESGEWKMTDQGSEALGNAILGDMQALQSRLNSMISGSSAS